MGRKNSEQRSVDKPTAKITLNQPRKIQASVDKPSARITTSPKKK